MSRARLLAAFTAIVVAVGLVLSTPSASAAPWYCIWFPGLCATPTPTTSSSTTTTATSTVPSTTTTTTTTTTVPPTTTTTTTTATSSGTVLSGRITWYSAPDNDPPGSRAIAYPGPSPRHQQAGGTGTYADPQTFASEHTSTFPPGTIIYVPRVKRYYVMEDYCGCSFPANHVDLWLEPSGSNNQIIACENALTQSGNENIIKNPDPNRPVDLRPLISNGVCRVP